MSGTSRIRAARIGYWPDMNAPLPHPVGPLSAAVIAMLTSDGPERVAHPTSNDALDHDAQLALFVLNELSFGGWPGVDDSWECRPGAQRWRRVLSEWFESALRDSVTGVHDDPVAEARRLLDLSGPSVSAFLEHEGTVGQLAESMILRSPYQGKEADPHTFAIPRLPGGTKRTLIEIQTGEYGIGHARSHAELFADAMEGLGLDPTPMAHVDRCDGAALATSNLVSLGGLQRRLRGVVLGQLSLFEMDSVSPNGRMLTACERLGLGDDVSRFFQIHVWADVEHEEMAERQFLATYPSVEPDQVTNLLLGMRAQSYVDRRLAGAVVPRWRRGVSALASHPLAA
ncbi:iron-containing redox enzyme family protein [Ilumatobacter sp.]|uniref:iron-containing redox enzyme family protein n=1 Tax=Ilumatobacter sp. TaxID=1967498 RepID=UPI003B5221C7